MSAVSTEKSPSIFGVYFFAVLIVLLSGLLGFAYMASFSPQVFSSQAEYEASLKKQEKQGKQEEGAPPPPSKPSDAYYIKGSVLRTQSWMSKRERLAVQGAQTVAISEGEINAWLTSKFQVGKLSGDKGGSNILIVPGVPNVAIAGDMVYLNIPTELSAFGYSGDFEISARCIVTAGGVQFQSIYVNSAKVPLPNLLGKEVLKVLAQGYRSTDEYKIIADAFARAESIEVGDSRLVFKLR